MLQLSSHHNRHIPALPRAASEEQMSYTLQRSR